LGPMTSVSTSSDPSNGTKVQVSRTYIDDRMRKAILITSIGMTVALTVIFQNILHESIIFTHLYYIPIVLAALWYGRRGVLVAIFLAAFLIFSDILIGSLILIFWDLARCSIFLFIAMLVSYISERMKEMEDRMILVNQDQERKVEARTQDISWANERLMEQLLVHKEMEAELQREKEWLFVTLRSIGDAVITTDANGKITMVNQVAERMLRYRQDEIVGRPVADVVHLREEHDGERILDPLRRGLSDSKCNPAHFSVMYHSDGTKYILADSAAPIIVNGVQEGSVLVLSDITEQELMREESIRLQKLRSMELLAGGIAHDFNNLLTAISGRMLMARHGLDEESFVWKQLEEAERGVVRARDLTKHLQNFAKTGSPVPASTSVDNLLIEVTEFVLTNSPIRTEFEMAPDLWPVKLDGTHMGQLISNLIMNAKEAMPNGGTIKVGAENVHFDADHGFDLKPGDYVHIVVMDEGVGMTPESMGHIFEPYFTTKPVGSGLGLAIVNSIIVKQGGLIRVESTVGKGTKFELFLPACPRDRSSCLEQRQI
jgi:two-component system cell cycle sensor histidine kinase/response regulator CckA